MFYIAPAWTNEIKELNHDPLKNLVSLLDDGGKPVKLMVLNFIPKLRYILHVNGLTNLPFWNLWDAILVIERIDGMPLGPESFEWPDDIRMVRGLHSMVGYRGNELAAETVKNPQGFIQTVKFLGSENNRFDIFDDRGFKVSTKYMIDDRVIKQEWFNEVGQRILRYEPDNEAPVKILSNFSNFKHSEYASLDDLFLEFVNKKFADEFDEKKDNLIASSSERIRSLMVKIQKQMPVAYLLDHQGKVSSEDIQKLVPQIEGSTNFVIPNYALFEQIQLKVSEPNQSHLDLGYPYGADMRLGNSNEERQLIIYWNIGDANDDQNVVETSNELMDYYLEHENMGLIVSTLKDSDADIVCSEVLKRIFAHYDFLDENEDRGNLNEILFNTNNEKEMQELLFKIWGRMRKEWELKHPVKDGKITVEKGEEPESEKIDWDSFKLVVSSILIRKNPRDYQIFDDLARTRIMVDMGDPYDARMQFNAISTGIPQINMVESPFVINRENGWIVTKEQSLSQGLDFYLKKLGNWNVALVNTAKYMEQLEFRRQSDWWERRMRYDNQR